MFRVRYNYAEMNPPDINSGVAFSAHCRVINSTRTKFEYFGPRWAAELFCADKGIPDFFIEEIHEIRTPYFNFSNIGNIANFE